MTRAKLLIKRALAKYPAIADPLRSIRFLSYCRRRFEKFQEEFRQQVYGDSEIEVLCGPFTGLRYFNKVVWGPITPKWIGSYEAELHEVIRQVTNSRYDTIVDIGAAEGYYAVGLARVQPESKVITYDIDFITRRRLRALARLNGIAERIDVRVRADHEALQTILATGRCLVISDIEGAEYELIDPGKASHLARVDLLVECHRTEAHSVDQVADVLVSRFEPSHRIEEIGSCARSVDEWSRRHRALERLSPDVLAFAINEFRYPQKWLWMRVK
jgi:hypothetical protein